MFSTMGNVLEPSRIAIRALRNSPHSQMPSCSCSGSPRIGVLQQGSCVLVILALRFCSGYFASDATWWSFLRGFLYASAQILSLPRYPSGSRAALCLAMGFLCVVLLLLLLVLLLFFGGAFGVRAQVLFFLLCFLFSLLLVPSCAIYF